MYTLIMILLFGDFTITAPAGQWIDYARSGRLSPNRHIVLLHNGTKGQYDQGPSQPGIYDDQGQLLYIIEDAANAWFIRNRILGSEDTFCWQTRENGILYLWHPDYGKRELPRNDFNLGYVGLDHLRFTDDGKQIYIASNYPFPTDDGKYIFKYSFERVGFLDASAEDLFASGEIKYTYHRLTPTGAFFTQSGPEGFISEVMIDGQQLFFHYKMSASVYGDPQFEHLPLPEGTVSVEHIQFGYTSTLFEDNLAPYRVLYDDQMKEVFRRDMAITPIPGSPAAAKTEFLDAFGKSVVAWDGTELAFLGKKGLVVFKPSEKTFHLYDNGLNNLRPQRTNEQSLINVSADCYQSLSFNAANWTSATPTVLVLP